MKPRRVAPWPIFCPACNVGQPGNCDCPAPAEAATHFGYEHEPAPSTRLRRLRARLGGWLAALLIVALYGLAGDRPADILAEPYLPGDGFPPELLAAVETTPPASEARP